MLERLLGQTPAVTAVGEIRQVFARQLLHDGRCGCGLAFRSCPFWTDVFDHAFGGFGAVDAPRLVQLEQRLRTRWWPLTFSTPTWHRMLDRLAELPDVFAQLYRAVRDVNGSEVVVDGSKDPVYASVIASRPEIDLRMVHLVRDPRATTFSWQRRKLDPGELTAAAMVSYRPEMAALMWSVLNADCTRFARARPDRYLRVRYEDLVARPQPVLAEIGAFAGIEVDVAAFRGDRRVVLGPSHTVWGNANRFDTGEIEIRADDEWEARATRYQRLVAAALAGPVARSLGYRHLTRGLVRRPAAGASATPTSPPTA